jgi:hypothetical protein
LQELVEAHIKRKRDYYDLLVFMAYFLLYVSILALEADPSAMFKMQQSIQNAFLPEAASFVSGRKAFGSWLSDTVLANTFKDATCGNGLCEAPAEFPAYGIPFGNAYGCAADCGYYTNTTTVQVKLQTHFSGNQNQVGENDKLAWNVCSSTKVHDTLCYYKVRNYKTHYATRYFPLHSFCRKIKLLTHPKTNPSLKTWS